MTYTSVELRYFRDLFHDQFPYIYLDQIHDVDLDKFLNQKHVKNRSISWQIELCKDWVMANQMCDYQE